MVLGIVIIYQCPHLEVCSKKKGKKWGLVSISKKRKKDTSLRLNCKCFARIVLFFIRWNSMKMWQNKTALYVRYSNIVFFSFFFFFFFFCRPLFCFKFARVLIAMFFFLIITVETSVTVINWIISSHRLTDS